MTFTVNTLSRCAGLSHYTVNLTFAGGATVNLRVDKAEIDFDPAANLDETRDSLIDRLRSAIKEANAATWAQSQAALEGKTFKI